MKMPHRLKNRAMDVKMTNRMTRKTNKSTIKCKGNHLFVHKMSNLNPKTSECITTFGTQCRNSMSTIHTMPAAWTVHVLAMRGSAPRKPCMPHSAEQSRKCPQREWMHSSLY